MRAGWSYEIQSEQRPLREEDGRHSHAIRLSRRIIYCISDPTDFAVLFLARLFFICIDNTSDAFDATII
jgi:hypothetical protein